MGKVSLVQEPQLSSEGGSPAGTRGMGKVSPVQEPQPHGSCSKERKEGGDCPDLEELEVLVEQEWRQVVVFFMLRQALAPCVERLLLLDRTIFLLEQGSSTCTLNLPTCRCSTALLGRVTNNRLPSVTFICHLQYISESSQGGGKNGLLFVKR